MNKPTKHLFIIEQVLFVLRVDFYRKNAVLAEIQLKFIIIQKMFIFF